MAFVQLILLALDTEVIFWVVYPRVCYNNRIFSV